MKIETRKIKISDLPKYEMDENIVGFGLCGYDCDRGGYIYLSEGRGNLESYVNSKEIVSILEEDGFDIEQEIEVEFKNNKLYSTTFFPKKKIHSRK